MVKTGTYEISHTIHVYRYFNSNFNQLKIQQYLSMPFNKGIINYALKIDIANFITPMREQNLLVRANPHLDCSTGNYAYEKQIFTKLNGFGILRKYLLTARV